MEILSKSCKFSNIMKIPTIYPVACHTDNVGLGTTFVAIRGTKHNGIDYVSLALDKGATTIVIEEQEQLSIELENVIVSRAQLMRVSNARKALAQLSAEKLDYPAKKLKIIAITGTKGKSTSTFLLEHILRNLGYKTAMLSTVKNRIGTTDFPTQLTTQLPDYLQVFLHQCVQERVEYVVMEVAAQALTMHRVEGISFCAALFTNFSMEHLEFYDSMEEYFSAKQQIIKHLLPDAPLCVNYDDPKVSQLDYIQKHTFGIGGGMMRAQNVVNSFQGLQFDIVLQSAQFAISAQALAGLFNVYNCLGALSICYALGIHLDGVGRAIATFSGVPGRLQRFALPNGAIGLIDYASNPLSFEAVLSEIRPLTIHLIAVFGAGGERDRAKRPLMGKILANFADTIILTSDNPRSEDPLAIIQDIQEGIDDTLKYKVITEIDRELAIKKAYALSDKHSIIILLGKGAEDYQIIKGVKHPFNEAAILQAL